MAPWAIQPFGEAGTDEDEEPIICHLPNSHTSCRSPRITVKIAGIDYSFLLDTGAELSILPSYILSQIPAHYFPDTPRQHTVHAFGSREVTIMGPYSLPIYICGVTLLHPFYTLDTATPLVAGYDLICAAKLVIDSVRECIWTYWFIDGLKSHRQVSVPDSVNSVHALTALPPTTLIRPADQWLDNCMNLVGIDTATTEETESTPQRLTARPSSDSYVMGPSAPVPYSGPSALVSSPGPSAPVSSSGPSATESCPGPSAPVSCSGPCALVSYSGPCAPVSSTGPGAFISHPDSCSPPFQSSTTQSASQDFQVYQQPVTTEINTITQLDADTTSAPTDPSDHISREVPEHLQELFQSTVQDNNLSSPLASELKDLFVEHKDTFATGPTDIGYCDLLQHDIDTGDHFPIKQSPRRPPLSARQVEDDILDEMLESGVIEPSMGISCLSG